MYKNLYFIKKKLDYRSEEGLKEMMYSTCTVQYCTVQYVGYVVCTVCTYSTVLASTRTDKLRGK